MKELHEGGLTAHAKRDKTMNLLEERHYLPQLKIYVAKYVKNVISIKVTRHIQRC